MFVLRQVAGYFSLIFQVGLLIVVSIFLGFRLGNWLDGILGTGMLLTIAGLILGVLAGFWGAYRTILRVIENAGESDRNEGT